MKKKTTVRKAKPRKVSVPSCKKCKHTDTSKMAVTQVVPVYYSKIKWGSDGVFAVNASVNEVIWDVADEPVVRCVLCGLPVSLPKGATIEWE